MVIENIIVMGRKKDGWLIHGGIAAVMNVRQTYTVKHIQTLFILSRIVCGEIKSCNSLKALTI